MYYVRKVPRDSEIAWPPLGILVFKVDMLPRRASKTQGCARFGARIKYLGNLDKINKQHIHVLVTKLVDWSYNRHTL